jgi:Na+/proline symporter
MDRTLILVMILLYFGVLLTVSWCVWRRHSGDGAFFLGDRCSRWWVVSFGMLSASLSGVTFVSVPGMVCRFDMTYLQMVLGFLVGYLVIAFVLLPVYYRLNVTSIYTYLEGRIGRYAYKTGACFFILSRTVCAAARMYVAVHILQAYVFDGWSVPFAVTASCFILMIWFYTHRGGTRVIVWTDVVQSTFLVLALVIILYGVASELRLDLTGLIATVRDSPYSRIFVFDNLYSTQHFVKQFVSGIFVTIAMTGVDQEMMQKNLSCRNLREAQRNVCTYGALFLPVNFLFLCLGILAVSYATVSGITLPAAGDDILPFLVWSGRFGLAATAFFTVGIIAVTFAGSDSALTGLTTSICIDIVGVGSMGERAARRVRLGVHFGVSLLFIAIMLLFRAVNDTSVIDALYRIVSYTYGPLLGLFAFGILFRAQTRDRYTPYVCVLSPILCFVLSEFLGRFAGYRVGYELLIANALFVVLGLHIVRTWR